MNKVRWGLIGCGDISRKRVAPALRDLENSEFVAVSRARAELAEAFAKEFGARKWYADWRDLLGDPEIDAVYIATPVYLHAEQTIAAAEAGKHVLCEKPMALDVSECDRMIAACRRSGVKLGIAYYRHFYPVVNRIKAAIASGEIGQPMIAQINAFEYMNMQPDDPRAWFITRAQSGGGPMMDFGCHRIEVLINIFGRVTGTTAFTDSLRFTREVEDTSAAFFKFESGPRATLTVTHTTFEPQDTLDIFGTAGSIHVPILNKGLMTIKTAAGERAETHPPHPNLQQPLIDDFAEAVLEGREPRVGGGTGREVARIEEEIYRGGPGIIS
ncbi:MAG TPA: Gfo/Idh/MocA family oxidoreductase [Blastocatellia bacterium]|nr:Gfo/Idh/MocA family oxidoreductase [Blastocatellia bacterium]